MSMTCKICRHPQRREIDQDISTGVSLRNIAARIGVSHVSVQRHKAHLADLMATVNEQEQVTARAIVLEVLAELRDMAMKCRQAKAGRDYLLVADRITRAAEVLGKITREIAPNTVNLLLAEIGAASQEEARSGVLLLRSADGISHDDAFEEALSCLETVLRECPEKRQDALRRIQAPGITNGSFAEVQG